MDSQRESESSGSTLGVGGGRERQERDCEEGSERRHNYSSESNEAGGDVEKTMRRKRITVGVSR